MELIELHDIYKTYHMGDIAIPVLKGVSMTLAHGELVALMGASGSGKSTLMNILGCLDRPSSGEYWLDGEEVSGLSADQRALVRNRKLGFVFQNFNLLARTSALENVTMPLSYTADHLSEGMARRRAEEMLCRVGLQDRLHHEPSQLSGGQQQRVAIARALVNRPRLLFADEPTGNLDSRTSEEVLRMFQQLNKEDGITIILVTHDANVARHANRIIHIHDGVIIDGDFTAVATPTEPRVGFTPPAAGSRSRNMKGYRTVRRATKALLRNPMRAMLTTLGIIIGVGAVIAMMEIGAGSSSAIQKSISSMGANVLLVRPGTAASGGVSFGAGSTITLTPEDCEAILRECPAIRSAAPVVRARTQVVYGNRNWVPSSIFGTTPAFLDVRDWTDLAEGELFNDRDVLNANKVCLLGQTLVQELFQGESPVGKEIRVKNVLFRIVGVLSRKGADMMGHDQDDILLAPWTTIKYRVTGSTLENTNQSSSSGASADSLNTLSNLYPSDQRQPLPRTVGSPGCRQSDARPFHQPRPYHDRCTEPGGSSSGHSADNKDAA